MLLHSIPSYQDRTNNRNTNVEFALMNNCDARECSTETLKSPPHAYQRGHWGEPLLRPYGHAVHGPYSVLAHRSAG